MPRYTFVKTNDGEVDDDMMAATAGISMDVCKRCNTCHPAHQTSPMYKAAEKLFAPEYWGSVMEMAVDGTPDAFHPDYDEQLDFGGYRCGLCKTTLRSRDNSEAHYTQ